MSDTESLFSNLSNDSMFFLNIDLKMCAILLFIILFSIFTMSSAAIMAPRPQVKVSRYLENFSNNEFYSYKNIDYSNYTSIPLTALDISSTNKSPSNLLFGGANRMITTNSSGDTFYTMDINANLYVLGGQVYDSAGGKVYDAGNQKIVQKYIVQLVNPKVNKTYPIGILQKGGDGIYKLNYKLNIKNIPKEIGTVDDLINYNIIQIIYNAINTSGEVLQNKVVIQGNL